MRLLKFTVEFSTEEILSAAAKNGYSLSYDQGNEILKLLKSSIGEIIDKQAIYSDAITAYGSDKNESISVHGDKILIDHKYQIEYRYKNGIRVKEFKTTNFPDAYKAFWKFVHAMPVKPKKPISILDAYELNEFGRIPVQLDDFTDEELGIQLEENYRLTDEH